MLGPEEGRLMTERISAAQFLESVGDPGWSATEEDATVTFRTGTFEVGVRLVVAIGELADAADHHPDVDLRYPTVVVRVTTHDVGGLSHRDVELARELSLAAAALGVSPVDSS
jgi:pterin-4a-carbinolamine dehydratase